MSKTDSHPQSAPALPSINVTPLIDVLLVLLIIFMVIQPQREAKLPVRAPAESQQTEPAPETLMLTVTGDFQLALNTQRLTLDELISKLTELMNEREPNTRSLFIKAPQRVSYQSIVSLIDLAKGAGVLTVGLRTED